MSHHKFQGCGVREKRIDGDANGRKYEVLLHGEVHHCSLRRVDWETGTVGPARDVVPFGVKGVVTGDANEV